MERLTPGRKARETSQAAKSYPRTLPGWQGGRECRPGRRYAPTPLSRCIVDARDHLAGGLWVGAPATPQGALAAGDRHELSDLLRGHVPGAGTRPRPHHTTRPRPLERRRTNRSCIMQSRWGATSPRRRPDAADNPTVSREKERQIGVIERRCCDCGAVLPPQRRGRPRKRCHACAGERGRIEKEWRLANPERVAASNEARREGPFEKTCVDCGASFLAARRNLQTRCPECQRRYRNSASRPGRSRGAGRSTAARRGLSPHRLIVPTAPPIAAKEARASSGDASPFVL